MTRVLVTGGTGYIGQRLVGKLVEAGISVAVVTRSASLRDAGVSHCHYDGTYGSLARFVRAWQPDTIVHLAADLTKNASAETIDSLIDSNVRFTLHLGQVAVDSAVEKFVNISTFSTTLDGRNYQPQTLYAATKKAAENLLTYYHQSTDLSVCTLCLYDVYGPSQPHARFLPGIVKSINDANVIVMTRGEQEICFVYVDDVVDSILFVLRTPRCFSDSMENIFTVHGDEIYQLRQIPPLISEVMALPLPPIEISIPYRANEIMKFRPPHPRLPAWTPMIGLREGISNIIAHK